MLARPGREIRLAKIDPTETAGYSKSDSAERISRLREKLAEYRSRIRVVLPKLSATHPELLLVASMFHHYHG